MLGQINCLPFSNYLAKLSHSEFPQSSLKRWTCLAHDLSLGMWEPDFQQVKTEQRDDVFKVCIRKPFKKRKMKQIKISNTSGKRHTLLYFPYGEWKNKLHYWLTYFIDGFYLFSTSGGGYYQIGLYQIAGSHRNDTCQLITGAIFRKPWRKWRTPHGFHVLL